MYNTYIRYFYIAITILNTFSARVVVIFKYYKYYMTSRER